MKQRVIIVTKFYYRRGGDCIYALNLERMLREHGHETAVFAMNYGENDESAWSGYWPEEVGFDGGLGAKLKAVRRTLGFGDVKTRFARLLDEFRPDVVHLNNVHSYLSPVVAGMARRRGIRVVWTLHDYKLLCPAYACLRNGHPCELCFDSKLPVLRTRCMKGSAAASAIALMEAWRWNRRRLQHDTDRFICPSVFMAEKMRQGHFATDKIEALSNFMAPEMIESYRSVDTTTAPRDYYCYIGRLSEEKGVTTLLKAASRLPYKLIVTGDGALSEKLRNEYGGNANIVFTGRVDAGRVRDIVSGARMSVMPSECYENNPLGIIESFCAGTPVVGAAIGGIPELVSADRGLTFESGSVESLKQAIVRAWNHPWDNDAIKSRALDEFSPERYYSRLTEIYGG